MSSVEFGGKPAGLLRHRLSVHPSLSSGVASDFQLVNQLETLIKVTILHLVSGLKCLITLSLEPITLLGP